jgi:dipeptidyl-peptidase-4
MPRDNQAGYDYGSNLLRADALQGQLLLVAGTRDPMVFAGTMKLVGALVAAGKPHDLIVLPEQPHDYSGASAVFFRDAVRRYFVRHLRPFEER